MASGSGVFWTMMSMLRAPSRTDESRANRIVGVSRRPITPCPGSLGMMVLEKSLLAPATEYISSQPDQISNFEFRIWPPGKFEVTGRVGGNLNTEFLLSAAQARVTRPETSIALSSRRQIRNSKFEIRIFAGLE